MMLKDCSLSVDYVGCALILYNDYVAMVQGSARALQGALAPELLENLV